MNAIGLGPGAVALVDVGTLMGIPYQHGCAFQAGRKIGARSNLEIVGSESSISLFFAAHEGTERAPIESLPRHLRRRNGKRCSLIGSDCQNRKRRIGEAETCVSLGAPSQQQQGAES